jgi:hypothetical protein
MNQGRRREEAGFNQSRDANIVGFEQGGVVGKGLAIEGLSMGKIAQGGLSGLGIFYKKRRGCRVGSLFAFYW